MKLKNLFLTSLVALALGACSNASEEATTANTENNAVLGFSLSFPTSTSRGPEVGETWESNVNEIDVRVKGAEQDLTFNFTVNDFTKGTDGIYTLKDEKLMHVTSGSATVYVTVNSANHALDFTASGVVNEANYTSLDALTASGSIAQITTGTDNAKTGHFLMTGSKDATIAPNTTTTVKVPVNRVAAKIEELSLQDNGSFTVTKTYDKSTTLLSSKTLAVKLVDYTFLNLNKSSYLYPQTNTYVPATSDNTTFFNFNLQNKISNAAFPTAFKEIVRVKDGAATNNGITYCMENVSTTLPTYVVYKASIWYDGVQLSGNCYTLKKGDGTYKFYENFAALDADNSHVYSTTYHLYDAPTGTQKGSVADFAAAGVTKYENGSCYYVIPIYNSSIQRNNWYKLTVGQIVGLGNTNIDPSNPSDPTLLKLQVEVMPWTVNNQTINF